MRRRPFYNRIFCRTLIIFLLIVIYLYVRYFILLNCQIRRRNEHFKSTDNQVYRGYQTEECTCNNTKEPRLTTGRSDGKNIFSVIFNNGTKHRINTSLKSVTGIFKPKNNATTLNKGKFLEIFQAVPGVKIKEYVKELKKMEGYISQYSVESLCCKYLINPRHHCNKPKKHDGNFLIFMVKSKYEHWQQRQAIRQTWGNETYLNDFKLRTVFVLGEPSNRIQNRVAEELSMYDDILQLNIKETYFNNILKTIATFHWLSRYCNLTTKYAMMVDDDYYVSPEGLVNMLHKLPGKRTSPLYMGVVYENAKPHKVGDNFYLSDSEYPYKYFPPYTPAGSVIMSMDFVQDVQLAMHLVKPFKFDDVYIGIIAYFLQVVPQNIEEIYSSKKEMLNRHRDFSHVIASHGFNDEQLLKAWKSRGITQRLYI